MSTSCAQAIKNWEAKHEAVAAESTEVKLYCQIPPISKLDNSLNSLVSCEHLSLSTNAIDRFIQLNGLRSLKILSVGRNVIKKIEKLDDLAESLEQLWLSYNLVSSLDGLHSLHKLESLYVANNNIRSFSELDKLAGLPSLKDLLLVGNPLYEGLTVEERRIEVLRHLPNLTKIDGDLVKPSELAASQASGDGAEEA